MKYLHLSYNGDSFGRGFVAMETENRNDTVGIYRGDIGARSRQFWRNFAKRNNFKLVEVGR